MARSGKVRIAEVMRSESVVRQHKEGRRLAERRGGGRRSAPIGVFLTLSRCWLLTGGLGRASARDRVCRPARLARGGGGAGRGGGRQGEMGIGGNKA